MHHSNIKNECVKEATEWFEEEIGSEYDVDDNEDYHMFIIYEMYDDECERWDNYLEENGFYFDMSIYDIDETELNYINDLYLNWLKNSYRAVQTNNTVVGSVSDYTFNDWVKSVTEISFGNNHKITDTSFKIFEKLVNLKTINLNEYNCDYEITFLEFKFLANLDIFVVFNKNKIYKDKLINRLIHKYKYDELEESKLYHERQISYINTKLYELGFDND